MPNSSNIWTRLEPFSRSAELESGLQAAVHDPLWLLARQWQLREFDGEDAGSPVHVKMKMICTPITHFLPGPIPKAWRNEHGEIRKDASSTGQKLEGIVPLETWIEREPIREHQAYKPKLAAEAGLALLRLLTQHKVKEEYKQKILKIFPLKRPDTEKLKNPLDSETQKFLLLVENRVPDGEQIYLAHQTNNDAWKSWYDFASPNRTSVDAAVKEWIDWYVELFSEPDRTDNTTWIPERLEYSALVSAPTPGHETVLTVPEYTEGSLDWYSFNFLGAGKLGANPRNPTEDEKITYSAIPMPVSYRGMPALRYWEFEDARVDFGGMNAGAQQLAKLLLMEFALIAGDDWFIIPVTVPVGSLCSTSCLIVRDTFGIHTQISSSRAIDSQDNDFSWDMFRLSLDPQRIEGNEERPIPDMFFLPPTLGTSLNGAALEEVLFLRDEMANMAWAVERIVESPLSQPFNRSEAFFRTCQTKRDDVSGDANQPFTYRLKTEIPEHWIPLIAIPLQNGTPPMGLMRYGNWQGEILNPRIYKDPKDGKDKPVSIHEEEVPSEGVRVTRAFQYARWIDGKTYLWIGRRNGVGRGEGSSGLQFDVLEPSKKSDT